LKRFLSLPNVLFRFFRLLNHPNCKYYQNGTWQPQSLLFIREVGREITLVFDFGYSALDLGWLDHPMGMAKTGAGSPLERLFRCCLRYGIADFE
jgi:hypothetical protein